MAEIIANNFLEGVLLRMNVLEAISTRRSIGKMKAEAPSREQIEKMLQAAILAPNHHETQPWHFFVLAGKAREELGQIMMENLSQKMSETESDKAKAALEKERNKPLRSPVLVVVACQHGEDNHEVRIEDLEATAAATQNILLAAQELGLATIWRTGDAAYNRRVKAWLGLQPHDDIVGIVYVGYAAIPVSERESPTFEDKTKWLGWPED